jgi:hypothetical protein
MYLAQSVWWKEHKHSPCGGNELRSVRIGDTLCISHSPYGGIVWMVGGAYSTVRMAGRDTVSTAQSG